MAKNKPAPVPTIRIDSVPASVVNDDAARQLRESRRRRDSWYNSRSRFGGSGDPVMVSSYVRTRGRITRAEAENLFEFDWLTGRVVEQIAKDATREWVRFQHSDDPDKAEKLRKEDERLDGRGLFREAIRLARLHGSSLCVLGAWDGGRTAPEEPLKIERVRKLAFAFNVDRWLIFPRTWYRDIEEDKYGEPETYLVHRLAPIGSAPAVVHESRTIRFDGNPLPPLARVRNWGWGASVIDKVYDALRNWGMSNQAAASVIPSFITYAMKIGNLQHLIANGDFATISARMSEAFAQMATQNMMAYGADEEIQKLGTPVSGLPDLLQKFMDIVSGAVEIPKSILFQAESGGLGGNAAGSDRANYFDSVSSYQETYLRPRVRYWLDVIGVPLGLKPGEVSFEFLPLRQLTPEEEGSLYFQNAQADQIYINTQVAQPEQIAVHRFGGQRFNFAPPTFDTKREEEIVEKMLEAPVDDSIIEQKLNPMGGFPGGGPDGGGGGAPGGPPGTFGGPDDDAGFEMKDNQEAIVDEDTVENWYVQQLSNREDAHITKPGSRGGHIIAYKNGEPVYGNPKLTTISKIEALPTSGPKVDRLKQLLAETATWGGDRARIAEQAAHGYRHPGSTVYTARDKQGRLTGITQVVHMPKDSVHMEFLASAPNVKGVGRELLRTAAMHAMNAGEDLTWQSTVGSDPYYRNAVGAAPEDDLGPGQNFYRISKDQMGHLVHQGNLFKEQLKKTPAKADEWLDDEDDEDLSVGFISGMAVLEVIDAALEYEPRVHHPPPKKRYHSYRDADGHMITEVEEYHEDIANPKKVLHPGSRGGHIVGYDKHGNPIYGKKGQPHPHEEVAKQPQHHKVYAGGTNIELLPPELLGEKIENQKGTNPGGVYLGTDGIKRYVKHYTDPAQAYSEAVTNNIYRALGLGAPKGDLVPGTADSGKVSYASKWLDAGEPMGKAGLTKELAHKLLNGFAADVLTANWDVMGLDHDNILIGASGGHSRIDNGGSLLFRAKAGRKPESALNNAVADWNNFADYKNPSYRAVFDKAGITGGPEALGQNLLNQIAAIKELRDKTSSFNDLVPAVPNVPEDDRQKIITMLNARTNWLITEGKTRVETEMKKGAPAAVSHEHTAPTAPTGIKKGTLPHSVWMHAASNPNGVTVAELHAAIGGATAGKYYIATNKLIKQGHLIKVGKKYVAQGGTAGGAPSTKPTLLTAAQMTNLYLTTADLMKHYDHVSENAFPYYSDHEINQWKAEYLKAYHQIGLQPKEGVTVIPKNAIQGFESDGKNELKTLKQLAGTQGTTPDVFIQNAVGKESDPVYLASLHMALMAEPDAYANKALNHVENRLKELGYTPTGMGGVFTKEAASAGGKASHGGGGGHKTATPDDEMLANTEMAWDEIQSTAGPANAYDYNQWIDSNIKQVSDLQEESNIGTADELKQYLIDMLGAMYTIAVDPKKGDSTAAQVLKERLVKMGASGIKTPDAEFDWSDDMSGVEVALTPASFTQADHDHAQMRLANIKSKGTASDQYNAISLRTSKTSHPEKLAAWYVVLKNEGYTELAEGVLSKLKNLGYTFSGAAKITKPTGTLEKAKPASAETQKFINEQYMKAITWDWILTKINSSSDDHVVAWYQVLASKYNNVEPNSMIANQLAEGVNEAKSVLANKFGLDVPDTTEPASNQPKQTATTSGKKLPNPLPGYGVQMLNYIKGHYSGYGLSIKLIKYSTGIGKNKPVGGWVHVHNELKKEGKHGAASQVVTILKNKGYDTSSLWGIPPDKPSTKPAPSPEEHAATQKKWQDQIAAAKSISPTGEVSSKAKGVKAKKKVEFYDHPSGVSVLPELFSQIAMKTKLESLIPPDLPSHQKNDLLQASAQWAKNVKGSHGTGLINTWKGSAGSLNKAWYKGDVDKTFDFAPLYGVLKNAPKWTGPMYRGLHLDSDTYQQWMRAVVEDGVFKLDAPQGFSRKYSTATAFSGGPQKIILIVDRAKTVRMIEDIHGFKNEEEMIALPGTHYTVNHYEEFLDNKGVITTYIYMTEK